MQIGGGEDIPKLIFWNDSVYETSNSNWVSVKEF
jgi:hypothetical protein